MRHTIRHFRTQVPPIAQVVPRINGELKFMFLNRYKILADYLITALSYRIPFNRLEILHSVCHCLQQIELYTGMVQSRAFCLH